MHSIGIFDIGEGGDCPLLVVVGEFLLFPLFSLSEALVLVLVGVTSISAVLLFFLPMIRLATFRTMKSLQECYAKLCLLYMGSKAEVFPCRFSLLLDLPPLLIDNVTDVTAENSVDAFDSSAAQTVSIS